MQRNSNAGRYLLILAGMALLIAVPILLSGVVELRQGYADREQAQHASAARHLERAAHRLPWRSDLLEQAGIEAHAAQDYTSAIRLLKQAPELSQTGHLALAQSYHMTGDLDEALKEYETALQSGALPEIYAGLADIHRSKGELSDERAALQNQLLFQPENAIAHYRLGLLLSLTNINLSLTHLELASHLDSSYLPVFQTLRSTLVLARVQTGESERYVTIGRGLGLVNEWALAREAFQHAVKADNTNAQAWAWLGEARWQIGQVEEASTAMDHALALDPASVIVRGLRGLYWKRMGDDRQAINEFEAAAAVEPQNPAWMVSLGESRARLGDLVSALNDYENAALTASQDPTYWRLLATFCADYNIHIQDIGLPAAQKAVELAPADPRNRELLGWLQLGAGQPRAAQKTLLAVLEEQPDLALAHYHLALAYLQTGDRKSAEHELTLAIQFDADGPTGALAFQVKKQQFP